MNNNNAIAFLTVKPSETLIRFAEQIHSTHDNDVYIFVDNDSYEEPASDKIKFIKVDKEECIKHHMYNSSKAHVQNQEHVVTSWDDIMG